MKPKLLILAVALPLLAAQSDPYQPTNDGSAAASQTVPPGGVAPGIDPGTRAANGAISSAQQASRAQHEADLAAYDSAVRTHGQQVLRDDARYARQQAAYADAMTAWRIQADACHRGKRIACKAPAPDPASFY